MGHHVKEKPNNNRHKGSLRRPGQKCRKLIQQNHWIKLSQSKKVCAYESTKIYQTLNMDKRKKIPCQ